MSSTAYEQDFYGWALDQANLLTASVFDRLDIVHLVEELQAMSARERRELVSRLRVLMIHLLKWQYQPNHPIKTSWQNTINTQRDDIALILEDSPSLRGRLVESIEKAYPMSVREASQESGLPKTTFPVQCPWTVEQLLDFDYLPE